MSWNFSTLGNSIKSWLESQGYEPQSIGLPEHVFHFNVLKYKEKKSGIETYQSKDSPYLVISATCLLDPEAFRKFSKFIEFEKNIFMDQLNDRLLRLPITKHEWFDDGNDFGIIIAHIIPVNYIDDATFKVKFENIGDSAFLLMNFLTRYFYP